MRLQRLVLGYAAVTCLAQVATAATPIGWLDAAGDGVFGGWARDDDFAGPSHVDEHDLRILLGCVSGSGNPADPNCAD